MKRFYILLIIIAALVPNVCLSKDEVRINIHVGTDDQSKTVLKHLYFGLNENATEGIDTVLGEKDLPPWTPPTDLYAVFTFIDTTAIEEKYTYVDMRPFPTSGSTPTLCTLSVKNAATKIYLSWQKIESTEIDSISLEDIFDDIQIVKVNMMEQQSYTQDLLVSRIDKFLIKIWAKNTTDVIDEETKEENIIVASNKILFDNDEFKRIKIFSLNGIQIMECELNQGHNIIDINGLTDGPYFITAISDNGKVFNKKILKM